MKKSNPTNMLAFQKAAFAELNQSLMNEINGGNLERNGIATSPTITIICQTKDW
jgi:hypothetical protein